MKLIHDILIRRLDISKDFDLNNEHLKSIWNFYQIYYLCLNILGINDLILGKKNTLIKKLIINPDNLQLLYKLKEHMSKDNKIIEVVLNTLKENEEIEEIFEDFYPPGIFAINIDDRGN